MLLIVINLQRNAGDEVQHPQRRHTDIYIYIYTGERWPKLGINYRVVLVSHCICERDDP